MASDKSGNLGVALMAFILVLMILFVLLLLFTCDVPEKEIVIPPPIMDVPTPTATPVIEPEPIPPMPTPVPTPTPTPVPTIMPTPIPTEPPDVEFTELLNAARGESRNCGETFFPATHSLAWNSQLTEAALRHSTDMFENNFFSHTGSDGSSLRERIEETGYPAGTVGEAIAVGFATNEAVLTAWLNSPPHCSLVMHPVFEEFGIAEISRNWTLDFANRK